MKINQGGKKLIWLSNSSHSMTSLPLKIIQWLLLLAFIDENMWVLQVEAQLDEDFLQQLDAKL
jgi:hypothetical protein